MRILAFARPGGEPRPGLLLEDPAGGPPRVLDPVAAGVTPPRSFLDWLDEEQGRLAAARALLQEAATNPARRQALAAADALPALEELTLLSPVPRPGKVLCLGLNYRDHAAESGMLVPEQPVLFSKFSSAVIGPGSAIRIPPGSSQVDYEAELAVVIGRRTRSVSPAEAMQHVLGYTCLNDVSARDFQFRDGQWQRGKSCDTFCPLGPWIVTRDELQDPHRLAIRLRRNGETLQDSNTGQLVFGVPELVAFLAETITLEPGDVIATGTPPGVGFARKPPVFLRPGDRVEVEIEAIGVLANPVAGPGD